MKKILIFSLAYYPNAVSGAEAAIKEITDRIDDIEFHMITLRFNREHVTEELLGNVHVHRVGVDGSYVWKILFIPIGVLTALQLHGKIHFDALWSVLTYMLFPVAIMRLLGTRIPHILTLQDGDPYEKVFERPFIRPLVSLLDYGFRSAVAVQAISTYLAAWPARRGYTGTVEMIYNGANPKDINETYDPKEVELLQKKINKQPGDVWLVNTARLEHQKAFDTTIRALPLLPGHVKFLIVGGGSDEEMLKALVAELKMESRVFFTGMVDRSVVTNYRKAADIFVGPSRSEGLGNAFLSAMASKLPVIATQEGGLAEFIFDEKRDPGKPTTAWAVAVDSPEEIADAVTEIMTNPEKVKRVGETARAMVLEKFNWDTIAREMRTRVFEPVIGA